MQLLHLSLSFPFVATDPRKSGREGMLCQYLSGNLTIQLLLTSGPSHCSHSWANYLRSSSTQWCLIISLTTVQWGFQRGNHHMTKVNQSKAELWKPLWLCWPFTPVGRLIGWSPADHMLPSTSHVFLWVQMHVVSSSNHILLYACCVVQLQYHSGLQCTTVTMAPLFLVVQCTTACMANATCIWSGTEPTCSRMIYSAENCIVWALVSGHHRTFVTDSGESMRMRLILSSSY